MKKIIFYKCVMMSAGMGLLMGLVFSIINQLKQNGAIQPIGILISMGISLIVSVIIGMIINMKKISDTVLGKWCHLDTFDRKKKVFYYIGESIIGSIIFTPANLFFNELYGIYMNMKMQGTFPPFATDFVSRIKFIFTEGIIGHAFLGSILPSILIGVLISLAAMKPLTKLTDKICGIEGFN